MRAIAVLFVPHYGCLPFRWDHEDSLRNLLFLHDHDGMIRISELPEKLRVFTAELIYRGVIEVMNKWQPDERIFPSLAYYDSHIIYFLKMLPDNDPMAEKLFSIYQLNDPVVFLNMDSASGYNPLYPILNEDIPEKWKKMAIEKMHKIILAEVNGQSKPRAEHEKAIECYLYKILLPLSGKDESINYGTELFASQIEFVLGLPNIRNRRLFKDFHVYSILRVLSGDQYRDLRHHLARYVVLENTEEFNRFDVYDRHSKLVAESMLSEFSSDQELSSVLQSLLTEAREYWQEEAKIESLKKIKEQDILNRMA